MLPGGSPYNTEDWLFKGLTRLTTWVGLPMGIPGCPPKRWSIPFPVVALEATLVFAFIRLAAGRLSGKGRKPALGTACLSAVIMVTLAAILDPVVSTSQWCGTSNDPGYHGLSNVELWHWYTNETHPGYWFGVPVVNYIAWFVGMGAFSFLARLDDQGPGGFIRKYDHWYQYVLATVAFLAILFLIQVPVKIVIDLLLLRGQDFLFVSPPVINKGVWALGLVVVLFGLSLRVIWWFRGHHKETPMEWIVLAPPLIVLAFCLVALLFEPYGKLFVVWAVSFAITGAVMGWPSIVRFFQKTPPIPQ
jgi:hypothetical protein